MAMKTLNPSQRVAVAGVIDPDALGAGTYETGWIDLGQFAAIMAVLAVGTMGASATIDAKLEQATDASGTGAKDIAGTAITQLTQAGTDDSDKQVIVQAWGEDLDMNAGFRFARLSVTIAAASCDAGAVVLGIDPRYGPTTERDLATVAEIVTAG